MPGTRVTNVTSRRSAGRGAAERLERKACNRRWGAPCVAVTGRWPSPWRWPSASPAGACAEEADAPETANLAAGELEGWVPLRTYQHADVVAYDQVAAAPAEDGAVWFTRASRDRPDLAVWTLAGGQEATEAPLSTPEGIVIPVAVASGDGGWTAVAVTRDQPATANTGVAGAGVRRTGRCRARAAGPARLGGSDGRPGVGDRRLAPATRRW